MTLQVFAVLLLGLMCGSELNVAAFAHPTLNRQPLETHILVRSSIAALLGRVMPFWMVGSTLLNLALLLPFEELGNLAYMHEDGCRGCLPYGDVGVRLIRDSGLKGKQHLSHYQEFNLRTLVSRANHE